MTVTHHCHTQAPLAAPFGRCTDSDTILAQYCTHIYIIPSTGSALRDTDLHVDSSLRRWATSTAHNAQQVNAFCVPLYVVLYPLLFDMLHYCLEAWQMQTGKTSDSAGEATSSCM